MVGLFALIAARRCTLTKMRRVPSRMGGRESHPVSFVARRQQTDVAQAGHTRRQEKVLVMCTIVYNSLKIIDITHIQSGDPNYVVVTSVEKLQTLKSIHQMMKIVEHKCTRTDHKQDTISNREEGGLYIG